MIGNGQKNCGTKMRAAVVIKEVLPDLAKPTQFHTPIANRCFLHKTTIRLRQSFHRHSRTGNRLQHMSQSKRKALHPEPFNPTPKRNRVAPNETSPMAKDSTSGPVEPDSLINHKAAIEYWSSTEATVNGVLGGYPQVSRVDLQGSANFFAKLRRRSKQYAPGKKIPRVVDCGAGIGRVTDGFLSAIAEKVDLVEPVKNFTDQAKATNIGTVYNVGLESWFPDQEGVEPYDLVWTQWCVGQLTDTQLVELLKRLQPVLRKGGWITVKENLSTQDNEEDIYDDTDSSVTRTDRKFRQIFVEAKLKIVATELQMGMPEGLYPVRTYALQPQ